MSKKTLTHLDPKGRARMVDVSAKTPSKRLALARAQVLMKPQTLSLLISGGLPKGDALASARLAGIMAAKKTPELIPLCHPIEIGSVTVDFKSNAKTGAVEIEAQVSGTAKTGYEMEALTAVTVAALTLYDMVKAVEKGVKIQEIRLVKKSGGKSGEWNE